MNNAKTTRRALLTSVVALVICLTMLMGTTFAWFTDTASVNVNKIQSGTLDIDLVDAKGATLVGKGALNFIKADNSTEILWEPGCTYKLPEVYVKNNGNLDLKYQIVITGIKGDAKLNEAIEWTITLDGKTFAATDWLTLEAGLKSGALTISGHMKEDAGNEYQDLTIDGIAITVNATQLNSEYDSNDNIYDKDAPQIITLKGEEYDTLDAAIAAASNGDTIKVQGEHTLVGNYAGAKTLTIAGIDGAALINLPKNSDISGYNLTFDNVFIQGYDKEDTFYTVQLNNATKVTYKNCTISGLISTYSDCEFVGCTFNNSFVDQYSVFCYGGDDFTFTNCTFNTPCSKAIKLYNEGAHGMNLTVTNCKFTTSTVDKAAVEIDSTHTTAGYTVTINNCTIDGAYKLLVNDKSTNSTITVDGALVELVKANTQEDLNNAIVNSTGDVTVELPAGTYTLPTVDNKDVTIIGTKDTIVDMSSNISSNGASLTFDGVTVNFDNDDYEGFQHSEKVVYENCVINGVQFLYSDAEFTNCTFNVTGDAYAVWTYGAKSVTFTDCTFNTNGKAVLVYTEAAHTATITATGCTFNDNGGVDGKAAIEVGESAYGNLANYTIKLDNCTVNGFDVNSVSNSNVWGNKNYMPTDRLNVVIDGTDVY